MRKRFLLSGIFISMLISYVAWRVIKPTNAGKLISDYKRISIESFQEAGGVEVGNEVIDMSDVDFEYRILTNGMFEDTDFDDKQSQKKLVSSSWKVLRNQILISIIERKLLFQMSEGDSAFKVTEEDLNGSCRAEWKTTIKGNEELYSSASIKDKLRSRLCEQFVVDKYMSERVLTDLEVSDEEAKGYYLKNRSQFHTPKRVTIKHMQLPDEKTAKNVLYRTTWRNFSKKAKKHSISPEGKNGGVLGPFSKAEMPPLFADAFKMRTKQISQIIKSTYGFHIIMLVKKHKEKTLAFSSVKDDIKRKLLQEKKKGKYQKWLKLALNSIDIKSKTFIEAKSSVQ
jgi:peptidyl-prolyl cis-trans isomerase C